MNNKTTRINTIYISTTPYIPIEICLLYIIYGIGLCIHYNNGYIIADSCTLAAYVVQESFQH